MTAYPSTRKYLDRRSIKHCVKDEFGDDYLHVETNSKIDSATTNALRGFGWVLDAVVGDTLTWRKK